MNLLIVLSVLLVINMLLMHGDKLVTLYYFVYKKIKKPKFKIGELAMIGGLEYQILLISENAPLYSYYCCPSYHQGICRYFHESKIDKKTGLLKELE
jgi:hypothetical protein